MAIFIPLISVFDAKGIREAKTGMSALAGVVKNLKGTAVAAAAAFATVGITGFVKESVTEARNLERNMVGLGNVFGALSPEMQQFSKDASAIGLSQVEASKASTFLGSVLKQSGFEMGTVSKETKNLVGLASDLAATYGYDVSEALTGMTALFRGEYDPIEKFGVAMKQSEVNAVLAARGQNKLTGATLRNATAQARLDILYERSKDAQGAYAEQTGSLFVAQTQLKASFDNLKASLGASMTGPLATLLASFVPIVDILGKVLAPIFAGIGKYIERLAPLLVTLGEVFLILFEAIAPIQKVLMELITPLLNPLVGIMRLLIAVVKPLIPVITLLANVLGAILLPIVTGINIAFTFLIEGIMSFFKLLSNIPFIGDAFKDMNKGLESLNSQMSSVNDKLMFTTDSAELMADQFSKKIDSNPVDGIGKAVETAGKKVSKTSEKIKDFLENAVGIQKSFIGGMNITGLLDQNNKEIVESITYIDGKFQTVVSSATKSSGDIVGAFKDKLSGLKGFYTDLNKLISAKLDPELIAQISSAGVEAGGATAKAILESGSEGITSLNNTFTGIKKIAGDIGFKTAQVMQDTGADIGNGLIDGLAAQSERLNAVATQMGVEFAGAFNAGANAKEKADAKKLIPKGFGYAQSTFVGSKVAMAEGQKTLGMDNYSLLMGKDIRNPFTNLSNPFAPGRKKKGGTFGEMKDWAIANAAKQKEFQTNLNKLTEYKIAINVAPGANQAAIGAAMVSAIQEYERKTGKVFTK
jgi:hypothetical protein